MTVSEIIIPAVFAIVIIIVIVIVIVFNREIEPGDEPGKAEKRKRVFKILAQQKSFFVRTPTLSLKAEWLAAIQEAAKCVFCGNFNFIMI